MKTSTCTINQSGRRKVATVKIGVALAVALAALVGCSSDSTDGESISNTSAPVFDASQIGIADVDPAQLRESLGQVVEKSKIANVGLDDGTLLTISGPLTADEALLLCNALDNAVYASPNNATLAVEISADGGPDDGLLVSRANASSACVPAP